MDMDDFFKKIMEEEMREDTTPETKELPEELHPIIDMLAMGKNLKFAKAAMSMKEKLINDLVEYITGLDKKDAGYRNASASARILMTAKKLRTLDVIISYVIICGTKNDGQEENALNSVININNL